MSNLPTTTNSQLPVLPIDQAWGSENVAQESVLIPRLILAQDLTEAVKNGVCRPGAILDSATGQVLAAPGEKLEIIPIYTFREWEIYNVIEERGKVKEKYASRVRVNPSNEGWTAEGYENGQAVKRVKSLNFFCLLPSKIDSMPYLVSFKKSGMNAGKKIATHFYNSGLRKVAPAGQTFSLSGAAKTWEGYTFQSYAIEPSRLSTIEEVAKAYQWYQLFTKNDVQVMEDSNA